MTGVVYLLFLNTISPQYSIILMIALSFLLLLKECILTKISLLFLSFLFFSAVVGVCYWEMVSLGSGGDSAYFANMGVSMVLEVVLIGGESHGIKIGRLHGHRWGCLVLGCLLTSVLVLVSVELFLN